MNKHSPILALSVTVLLLAGCASPEPSTEAPSTPAADSSTAATSPQEEPTEEESGTPTTETTTPEAEPSAEPAPETSPQPEPSTEPSAEPVVEPVVEAPEPTATPTATPTVTPSAPVAGTPEPVVPPHAEYAPGFYSDLVPESEFDAVRVVRHAGNTFTISGTGYTPGVEIQVFFGPYRTDSSLIGDATTYADASGSYTFQITLSEGLESGTYGVMTVPLVNLGTPEFEAAKRFATVDVVAP